MPAFVIDCYQAVPLSDVQAWELDATHFRVVAFDGNVEDVLYFSDWKQLALWFQAWRWNVHSPYAANLLSPRPRLGSWAQAPSSWGFSLLTTRQVRAYSFNGAAVNLELLRDYTAPKTNYYAFRYKPVWFRQEPVPGTGHGRYYRRSLRYPNLVGRARALLNAQEQEMEAGVRHVRPHSPSQMLYAWDDGTPRSVERSWKSQHKGRKAWAKPHKQTQL